MYFAYLWFRGENKDETFTTHQGETKHPKPHKHIQNKVEVFFAFHDETRLAKNKGRCRAT